MKRETENVVLLLVGVSVAVVTLSGTYTRYVRPSLAPWLAASAVVLVSLALAAIIRDVRRGAPHHNGDTDRGTQHGAHDHRTSIAWLLAVPIALLAFVEPPPISSSAAPVVTQLPTGVGRTAMPPLPPGRAPEIPLPEVSLRLLTDTAGSLDDRLITVVAFTKKVEGVPLLARVTMTCCAADARLTAVRVIGPDVPILAGYPDGTWVRVEGEGVPRPDPTPTANLPEMRVLQVRRIAAPEHPYAYF